MSPIPLLSAALSLPKTDSDVPGLVFYTVVLDGNILAEEATHPMEFICLHMR